MEAALKERRGSLSLSQHTDAVTRNRRRDTGCSHVSLTTGGAAAVCRQHERATTLQATLHTVRGASSAGCMAKLPKALDVMNYS